MRLISKPVVWIVRFFSSIVMYVFYWCWNRKNWKTIRQYFAIAEQLSKFAKKEHAAKNIGWLAKRFDALTKKYSDDDTSRAAREISSAKGVLDDLYMGYNPENGVTANVGPIEAIYDPRNGQVKFGLKL